MRCSQKRPVKGVGRPILRNKRKHHELWGFFLFSKYKFKIFDILKPVKKIIKFMKSIKPFQWTVITAFSVIVIAIGSTSWYGYDHLVSLSIQISSLETKLASTTAILQENITETQASFSDALQIEKQNVSAIKEQLGDFEQEVGEISGTVTILEKLSKTDEELLQKYSKVYFLNEHYAPKQIAEIDKNYLYSERRPEFIHALIWPYLKNLLDAAGGSNVTIYIKSAYRSFNDQESLKSSYTMTYGEDSANQFSADQGYSEHQLGSTADFITTGLGGQLTGFENTQSYLWMLNNAYKYGFILSYPKENGFYIFEPWHWRFVGIEFATFLNKENKNFYDLDQREIDKYLVSIFD